MKPPDSLVYLENLEELEFQFLDLREFSTEFPQSIKNIKLGRVPSGEVKKG